MQLKDFIKSVLEDIEDSLHEVRQERGVEYYIADSNKDARDTSVGGVVNFELTINLIKLKKSVGLEEQDVEIISIGTENEEKKIGENKITFSMVRGIQTKASE